MTAIKRAIPATNKNLYILTKPNTKEKCLVYEENFYTPLLYLFLYSTGVRPVIFLKTFRKALVSE